jgi:antitoxin component YwqK of YwqJK toxin-antitoxin module
MVVEQSGPPVRKRLRRSATRMNPETVYKTSIPAEARERITARYGRTGKKRAEYYLGKELVGIREFALEGFPDAEWAFRGGVYHGMNYRWYESGKLMSCDPWVKGKQHGTAYQWDEEGKLLGTYTMTDGNGLDLWWSNVSGEPAYLAEAYEYENGVRHGREWWWYCAGKLWQEVTWYAGEKHGIERQWNLQGRLVRGYPQYYLHNEPVDRRRYLRASAKDLTLRPFVEAENEPQRDFPPLVAAELR